MKRVNYIISLAACLAALLTSCIKEEPHEFETATLDVRLTRADDEAQSANQGDGISDVMVWAFQCTVDADGNPSNVDDTATGWRHMQNVDTYGTVSVHVPLPLCSGDKQSYVVVAVLNTDEFGDTIDFGSTTSYTQLTTGTFDASGSLFWQRNPDDEALLPENMPVSNWATITVTNDNTHPDNCYQLKLPVYRAVAKTQLYVRKTSSAFGLAITDAKVISSNALNEGFILSKCSQQYTDANGAKLLSGWIDADTVTPLWWVTPSDSDYVATTVQLCKSEIGSVDGSEGDEDDANLKSEFLPWVISYDENAIDEYYWVGSAFLYENDKDEVVVDADYNSVTTDNGGYYMAITYVYNNSTTPDAIADADGNYNANGTGNSEAITRYVPLPKVVRNHDYQIKAEVSVNVEGKLVVNYLVTDWTTNEVDVPSFN